MHLKILNLNKKKCGYSKKNRSNCSLFDSGVQIAFFRFTLTCVTLFTKFTVDNQDSTYCFQQYMLTRGERHSKKKVSEKEMMQHLLVL